jgi:hypothetical protein
MFRSSTIIRELVLNVAKVIFILKHSVELRRYLLCGCVAACSSVTSHSLFVFSLTFRHRASSIYDRRFATLQRTLFIYLINKYISLSDICLTVHH